MKRFIAAVFCMLSTAVATIVSTPAHGAILLESPNGVLVSGPATMSAACAQTLPIHITSALSSTFSNISTASGATCLAPVIWHPGGSLNPSTTLYLGNSQQQPIPPELFGANTTPGTTDMSAAINKAFRAFSVVRFLPTTYKTSSDILMKANQSAIGVLGQTTITPVGCNGFTVSGTFITGQGKIEGITVDGGQTNPAVTGGWTAFNFPGTTSTADLMYQFRIRDCTAINIMQGIYAMSLWGGVFERNNMQNVPLGIHLTGDTVNTKIQNNIIRRITDTNITGSIGILLDQYAYSVGGTQKPQDVSIESNEIYGYETGINVALAIKWLVRNNMIDQCSLYGIVYQADDDANILHNWIGTCGIANVMNYGIYATSTGSPNPAPDVMMNIKDNYIFENIGDTALGSTGYKAQFYSKNVTLENNTFAGWRTYDVDLTNISNPIFLYQNKFTSTAPTYSVFCQTSDGGYIVADKNTSAVIPFYFHPTYNTASSNDLGRCSGATQSTYAKGTTTITSGNTTTTINVPMGSNSYIYPVLKINNIVSTTTNPVLTNTIAFNAVTSVFTITSNVAAPAGGIKIYYEVQGVWYGDR